MREPERKILGGGGGRGMGELDGEVGWREGGGWGGLERAREREIWVWGLEGERVRGGGYRVRERGHGFTSHSQRPEHTLQADTASAVLRNCCTVERAFFQIMF